MNNDIDKFIKKALIQRSTIYKCCHIFRRCNL